MARYLVRRKFAPLKAPFPWFGGKSRASSAVWQAFGDTDNYVEPFCGSLAVLLSRPSSPGMETVNDLDCFVVNFWRAMQQAGEAVRFWADSPATEADLHARHRYIIENRAYFNQICQKDPDFFDAKVAGWWAWGASAWIGTGWAYKESKQVPYLTSAGVGVNSPRISPDWAGQLQARLRRVRVLCGDWSRALKPSVVSPDKRRTESMTAVLLDPPYSEGVKCYGTHADDVAFKTAEWARSNASNPRLRIVLCGYEGEHEMPTGWRSLAWATGGGFGKDVGNANGKRERLWLSPACLPVAGEVTI